MTRTTRLTIVLLLNLALVAGLVTAGITAHSLGVLAAGADYVADAAAIGVSLLAIGLARRPPSARRPGGYPHATAYAALLNAVLLVVAVALVAAGAIRRLAAGAGHVQGLPVLVASGIAALAMLGGGMILQGDEPGKEDTEGDRANMRAAILDTLADSAAAAGVAVTGAIILAVPALSWLDPAAALVISVIVGYHAVRLVRDVLRALRRPVQPPPPGTGTPRLPPPRPGDRRDRIGASFRGKDPGSGTAMRPGWRRRWRPGKTATTFSTARSSTPARSST